MGGCCASKFVSREGDRERRPLIVKHTPLRHREPYRQWGCCECGRTFNHLWMVTFHVGVHAPPMYRTYDKMIVKNY